MENVRVTRKQEIIPTYPPKAPNELPMFFENKPYQGATGRLYPLAYSDGITDEKSDVAYEVYTLENEYVKTQVLPELGGKILRGFDKVGQYDFIYHNEVIKPALVGLAGAWISGGIEFNWPQHHRPTTFLPLEAAADPMHPNTVWMGEVEPFNRMKGMVGITIDEGRSYIRAKVRVYNRTPLPQVFMWWANLAVPANSAYRTVFPPDVEWVNDHDRRAVLEWPIAKGVYRTARPYDFGEGTDLSRFDAVRVPSSYLVSQGQSDMDFISGYDTGLQKGIVAVGNHHIIPGKKMWHWGTGDFGEMWCSNLTDRNGPYIELMTGAYTDNQPDFTWIAPYESHEFEQYWYPVRDIGEVKNATIDAAMNLEPREGGAYLGIQPTGVFRNARICLRDGEKVLLDETADLDPAKPWQRTVPTDCKFENLTASVFSADGKLLVSYTPYRRGQKKPITPRQPVKRPSEIGSVEELYLNGFHLEQYKQHNYDPRDYYAEGLRRDPGDARCNTSMARLCLRNGDFDGCVSYCDKAIARLTLRNEHPADTEAFYLKGLALCNLGEKKEAYDILYKAAWNYPHRSAALFELANLDCEAGDYAAALEKLEESYGLNAGHSMAKNLKCAILRRLDPEQAHSLAAENATNDPLDLFALMELSHYEDKTAELEQFARKPENILDVVCAYLKAGFAADALAALELLREEYPLAEYYRGFCMEKLERNGTPSAAKAEGMKTGTCFPSRLEDIAVLNWAKKVCPNGANARYYLGCLYYDRFRYDLAAENWLDGLRYDPKHAKILRNLAFWCFDKAKKPQEARVYMERALAANPDDPRLLFEYQQLLKNLNVAPAERLAVYDRYPELLAKRDDCYLDLVTLVFQTGEDQKAIDLAAAKRFHIYEGGEGKLTRLHAWMHVFCGLDAEAAGDDAAAERAYRNGCVVPKSYGEAKTFFNQEAHLYWFLGKLCEKHGENAEKAYRTGAVYKAAVSEISLFRALCLRKLHRDAEADAVLQEMLQTAENQIRNCDLRSYYGVGSPSPMPFENDIVKQNLRSGNLLKAFALLGMGQPEAADAAWEKAAALSPYDDSVLIYQRIRKVIEP